MSLYLFFLTGVVNAACRRAFRRVLSRKWTAQDVDWLHGVCFLLVSSLAQRPLVPAVWRQMWTAPTRDVVTAFPWMGALYAVKTAFHVSHAVDLGPRPELWGSMLAHHVITLFLIAWSYARRPLHGFLVFYLHDASDIIMYLVRLVKNRPPFRGQNVLLTVLGPVLLFTWLYMRVFWFGYYVLRVWRESISGDSDRAMATALTGLWGLNVWWTSKIASQLGRHLMSE
jgi:hypothetical protein